MIAASMSMIRATLSYTAISTPHVHGLMALFRFAFAAGVSRKPPSMNVRFAAEHPQPPMARMRRIADRRLSNRNRPAATLVKCIDVDDEAEVVIAFAHTSDHARELFDEWNRLAYGGGGKSATVEEMSPGC